MKTKHLAQIFAAFCVLSTIPLSGTAQERNAASGAGIAIMVVGIGVGVYGETEGPEYVGRWPSFRNKPLRNIGIGIGLTGFVIGLLSISEIGNGRRLMSKRGIGFASSSIGITYSF